MKPIQLKLFPTICLIITAYFVYHGISGAHGYRRMHQVNEEIVLAKQYAQQVHAKRELLETKVKSLSQNSLDMDQLEESAMRILNMGKPEDIIILSTPKP